MPGKCFFHGYPFFPGHPLFLQFAPGLPKLCARSFGERRPLCCPGPDFGTGESEAAPSPMVGRAYLGTLGPTLVPESQGKSLRFLHHFSLSFVGKRSLCCPGPDFGTGAPEAALAPRMNGSYPGTPGPALEPECSGNFIHLAPPRCSCLPPALTLAPRLSCRRRQKART
jgi:hypothetical protein